MSKVVENVGNVENRNQEGGEQPVQKREWKCFRCQDKINIFVRDEDRKFIIEGDKIFCSKTCCSYAKQYIPVDPIKKKINDFKKKGSSAKIKKQKEPLFKCFNCEQVYGFLTWDKLCPNCISDIKHSITNEFKSLIRLHKIN